MEILDKIVEFHEYCKKCEFFELNESEEPCNECLSNPVNQNSKKPVNYKEKEKENKKE